MTYKIGSYARLSFDRNGEELAIERQHSDNEKTVARHPDWEIARYYTDNDLSAFKKNVVRPDFEQMLLDLMNGVIDGIVAYDLDRLWRQPRDLERVIDLYEGTPRPFATAQGDYDLSTTDGRTMARIMVALANKSSADTARRVRRKILEQAESGKPHWSRRPFGWNMDGTLDAREAAVLRKMGELFLSGYSYREVTFRLNEMGYLARSGKPWMNGNVRKMLANPRLAAIRVHDGAEYPGTWEPVFNLEEWQSLQDLIKLRRQRTRGVPNNKRYLLTGLLRCAKCQSHLCGMTKRDGVVADGRPLRRTYQCATSNESSRRKPGSCGAMCIGAEPLDHFIKQAVLFRLDTVDLYGLLARAHDDERMAALLGERKRLDARRGSLLDDYAVGDLSKRDYKRAVGLVDDRLSALEIEIDSLRRTTFKPALAAGETLREAWETRPDGWRRELIEVLIAEVTIHPSLRKPFYEFDGKRARFDPERVEIKWAA